VSAGAEAAPAMRGSAATPNAFLLSCNRTVVCQLQTAAFSLPTWEDSWMTTLLDKQRSTTRKVPSPEEATLDQVLSRIAALAPMVARLAPDIEQGR
jgi:hypothetical protein